MAGLSWNLLRDASGTVVPITNVARDGEAYAINLTIGSDERAAFDAIGNWSGSAELELYQSPDGGTTWVLVETLTANGSKLIYLSGGRKWKVKLKDTTGDGSTSLKANLG